jgi:ribosomal protein S18 acetylase RimI-like enzyme
MTLVIRPANEADVAALVTLLRRSWLATWAPEVPFTAVQLFVTHDPARKFAETRWQEMTVAEIEGEVVGGLHIEENGVRSIELAPERKRLGIGSRLMDEAEKRIRKDYSEARLDVRAFNVGAFEFYKQRGWTECRRYQGIECNAPVETIEMEKKL